jgi:UDP-N-acetylmuramoylalanine--D-glutamate ligase
MGLNLTNIGLSRVSVLGAARSGVDAALLMQKTGCRLFVSDTAPLQEKADSEAQLRSAGIEAEFGGHSRRIFEADAWVISPGIPVSHPLVRQANQSGIEVLGELEVASWFCRGKIAAITGSNGKSTTTTMLGEMLGTAGIPYAVAGNIGTSFSSQVEAIPESGVAVLEVSNFQLETIRDFHPYIGVFLNLTPDHLDRHGSIESYGQVKARLFENQDKTDFAIFNDEDPEVRKLMKHVDGHKIPFRAENELDEGAYLLNGRLMLAWGGHQIRLIRESEMGLPGPHNVANGLAAALAATLLGTDSGSIIRVLQNFRGLPHRMEQIRQKDGILWVNDSKATNIDSMQCALRSYSNPIILIAGGRDKNTDFTPLRPLIERKTKAVIVMGEAADKLANTWNGIARIVRVTSLSEAVKHADQLADAGDVVLLSPGCASFDMFENFEDRGTQFRELVQRL